MSDPAGATSTPRPKIPRTVWALGFVSLFMDVSSEMIHALLPVFLTGVLGVSVAMVGLIDGVAESTASISKVFSGYLSDRFGRRKPFILFGYGLGAVTKPLFALAGGPFVVLAARFADRIGKGIRGAPRDALVADVTPLQIRGRAYGLRQTLDTVGAFLGPALAILCMALFANDFRLVFWIAAIPAALAVVCVIVGVEEGKKGADVPPSGRQSIRAVDLKRLSRAYWMVVAVGVVFTLARFSEAFLILKASEEGLPLALTPLVLVAMNIVYMLGAFPAGVASDRTPAKAMLLAGVATLVAADLVLALVPGLPGTFLGIALWGAHMALTQGLFAKLVAQHALSDLRGSAFGVFNLLTGLALLVASVVARLAWDAAGSQATFLIGAACAVAAGSAALALGRKSVSE